MHEENWRKNWKKQFEITEQLAAEIRVKCTHSKFSYENQRNGKMIKWTKQNSEQIRNSRKFKRNKKDKSCWQHWIDTGRCNEKKNRKEWNCRNSKKINEKSTEIALECENMCTSTIIIIFHRFCCHGNKQKDEKKWEKYF